MTTATLDPTIASDGPHDPLDLATTASSRRTRPTRTQWVGIAVLLVGTSVLYLWGLSRSGYANSFYSAAVQAGSQSWKAFFFGSLDAGNAITVDKPPASLWLMALSVRIFGLSSWSILAPQAVLGVATVGVLYASVRRTSGHAAALLAGGVLALTPVAVLMFRFNNPDALLVFLLTAAGYLTLRATEKASAASMVGVGVLVGFAFLTKMLQAFLVLPAFALVYLIAAPTPVRRRLLHLVAAAAAMIISLGWWVAIVELVPASWRPYVGGSQNNSVLDLIFGYNGLARIFGRAAGGGGGEPAGGGGGFGGDPGITRLFDGVIGGMVSWLVPAALVLGLVALVVIRRAHRTNLVRAAIVLWAGWLLVTGLVFSFMAGTFHEYYTIALAPAIAGLLAVSGRVLWQRRATWPARIGLAVAMIITAVWAYELLGRASTAPYTTLRLPVLVIGIIAAVGLLLAHRLPKVLAYGVLGLGLIGAGAGPTAYALNTAATPHEGSIVTAGPVRGGGFGDGGGFARARAGQPGQAQQRQTPPGGAAQGGAAQGGGPGVGGGQGGEGVSTNTALTELLQSSGSTFGWAAATTGSQGAASYQLASGQPVMAIGGFGGGDPSPTLEQFQSHVAGGQIHYYVTGGNRGGPGRGGGSATQISTWVAEHFTATVVGGTEVYDLTQPK